MIQVSIFPPWSSWLDNRMFEGAEGCVYTPAFRRWRELAESNGFTLDTHDVTGPERADVVWLLDLPRTRKAFLEAKTRARAGTPLVLQIQESPLLFPAAFVEENRRVFDAVVSYEFHEEEPGRFGCCLPVAGGPVADGPGFPERRLAVMVNTNRIEGWLATRKSGITGLPGVGPWFSGWKLPKGFLTRPARGELYSWRRDLACEFERNRAREFDIFGPGWNGEPISWCPLVSRKRYRCARSGTGDHFASIPYHDKRQCLGNYRFVIAAENYRGSRSYISEKIFDAIFGGSVPVYLGEERIADFVPGGCFIDARRFSSIQELIEHLAAMREPEWLKMRKAGKEFLESAAFHKFTEDAFAQGMMRVLRQVTAGRCGKTWS